MPEEEARALLSNAYHCQEPPDWAPAKDHRLTRHIECGLLDEDERRASLYVSMRCTVATRNTVGRYVFSVFKLSSGPAERVYQLDVKNWPRLPNDVHSRPHEHIGSRRVIGDDSWIGWGYDQVIAHFLTRVNIRFEPEITDPNYLTLR